MSEMLAIASPESYIARTSAHDVKNIIKTRQAIRKAFEVQMSDMGFGLVEIMATCPTNWKLSPAECNQKIADEVIKTYPLGEFSNINKTN